MVELLAIYLISFLTFSNLGKHFFASYAVRDMVLIDYLQPVIYLQDVVIVGLVLYQVVISKKFRQSLKGVPKPASTVLFLAFGFLSCLESQSPITSIVAFGRTALYLYFAFFCAPIILKNQTRFFAVFLPAVILVSSLGLLQVGRQGSVAGTYLFFGEQPYTSATTNIAKETIGGRTIIGAYGTFRHPNVFGAYLSVVLVWLIVQAYQQRLQASRTVNLLYVIGISLGIVTLIFTFSLIALVVFFIGLFGYVLAFKNRAYFLWYSFGWLFCFFLLAYFYRFLPLEYFYWSQSLSKRALIFNTTLTNVTPADLIIGVGYGAGALLSTKALDFQPVHNSFLLILFESGLGAIFALVGMFVELALCYRSRRPSSRGESVFTISVLQLLLLGFFDHYLVTSQQLHLLFWLTIAFSYAYNSTSRYEK